MRHPRKATPAARICRPGLEPHPTPAARCAALRRAAGALRLHRTTIEALCIDIRRIVARGNAGEERACGTRERRRQPPGCATLAWSRTQP
ncbi:hypothetical protein [Halomonas citrativorans]|uniref:hypothetical protein n=1 Tax=Halomonas citrativorans TaxID=2742612 RepID=UPI00111E4341|nr:hypothetical protein [Halomonas citrativorans]